MLVKVKKISHAYRAIIIQVVLITSFLLTGCDSEDNFIVSKSDTQIDLRMDSSNQAGWWKPITSSNDCGTVYVAMNAPGYASGRCYGTESDHRLAVFSIENFEFIEQSIGKNRSSDWFHCDDPGHDAPSIAADGNGRLHVLSDLHHERGWNYFTNKDAGNL